MILYILSLAFAVMGLFASTAGLSSKLFCGAVICYVAERIWEIRQ